MKLVYKAVHTDYFYVFGFCLLRTTHTSNRELRMWPHLPRFYHNMTLLYCILSFQ